MLVPVFDLIWYVRGPGQVEKPSAARAPGSSQYVVTLCCVLLQQETPADFPLCYYSGSRALVHVAWLYGAY